MGQQSFIILAAFILFMIFRRVRRHIGWQLLHQRKMIRTILMIIIGLLFLAGGIAHPASLTGILIGMILAYCSAGTTRFE